MTLIGEIMIESPKTDNDSMPREENNLNKRPEIENLLSIYSSLSNQNLKNTIDQFSRKNFSEFKNDLAELVVEKISPISNEIKRLEKDPQFIDNILLNGSKKAEKMAKSKVEKLKKSKESFRSGLFKSLICKITSLNNSEPSIGFGFRF